MRHYTEAQPPAAAMFAKPLAASLKYKALAGALETTPGGAKKPPAPFPRSRKAGWAGGRGLGPPAVQAAPRGAVPPAAADAASTSIVSQAAAGPGLAHLPPAKKAAGVGGMLSGKAVQVDIRLTLG